MAKLSTDFIGCFSPHFSTRFFYGKSFESAKIPVLDLILRPSSETSLDLLPVFAISLEIFNKLKILLKSPFVLLYIRPEVIQIMLFNLL